jgi:hypothetical protein
VIRQQPNDRRIVIRDQHPWRCIDRLKFHSCARALLNVGRLYFASRSPHDVTPDTDCRIRVIRRTDFGGLSGISISIKLQIN